MAVTNKNMLTGILQTFNFDLHPVIVREWGEQLPPKRIVCRFELPFSNGDWIPIGDDFQTASQCTYIYSINYSPPTSSGK